MWNYIEEKQPTPGTEIEIMGHPDEEAMAAFFSVYLPGTKQILSFEDFEFWREKETAQAS